MRTVELKFDAPALMQWHIQLLTQLAALPGITVHANWMRRTADAKAGRLERVMALERRLHGLPRVPSPRLAIGAGSLHSSPIATRADLVVDLTGQPTPGSTNWSIRCDGSPGESALVDALRRGRTPLITIVDGTGAAIAEGRPGSDRPGLLATELHDLTAGLVTLIVGSVAGRSFATPVDQAVATSAESSSSQLAARRTFEAVRHRIYRGLYRVPHWRVGWRFAEGNDLDLTGQIGPEWNDLPDDGHHFYADPFPFEHDGRLYLFVEDFDHRVGRGVISVVDIDQNGPMGTPRPVLTHEVHLSYPFVIEHDGEIWMIPETSSARTVELYRCVDFPDSSERECVLMDGIEASDATPFQHDGRWWLTATVGHGGSLSDSLHVWSAPDLRGPWTPHADNPVLVDIASARPAGRVVPPRRTNASANAGLPERVWLCVDHYRDHPFGRRRLRAAGTRASGSVGALAGSASATR